MGAELFKNVEAEATGRLVFEAARHLGIRLTPEIATPLFAAIATDTGWFRFGSTVPRDDEPDRTSKATTWLWVCRIARKTVATQPM